MVRALFGERMSQRCDEIGDLFQRPQDYLESSAFHQIPHPFPRTARARVRSDRAALDAIIDDEIAHRRAHPTGDPLDILETLVADGSLSDAEIRDQVATLIGAGYDTTSASLAWMLIRATLVPRSLGSPPGRSRRGTPPRRALRRQTRARSPNSISPTE